MKRLLILFVTVLITLPAAAQLVPFNGLLLDGNGKPIRRARIYVSDPEKYTQSDKQGRFGLTNVEPNDSLHIRYNKQTYVIPIEGKRSIKIRLVAKQIQTEESQQLIDFGMNYVGQREYVGYDSKITGEQLMATGCTDILSSLSGMIPGLSVTENFETGTYSVSIRSGSFQENSQPLFVVDEVIVPSIDHIQLNQVAYVIVMKDAAVYGFRGGNGAIVVRTKSAELMSASEGKINSYQE